MNFSDSSVITIQEQMTGGLQGVRRKIKFKCLNLEASVGICFFKELKDPERERIYTNLRSKNVTAPSLVRLSIRPLSPLFGGGDRQVKNY